MSNQHQNGHPMTKRAMRPASKKGHLDMSNELRNGGSNNSIFTVIFFTLLIFFFFFFLFFFFLVSLEYSPTSLMWTGAGVWGDYWGDYCGDIWLQNKNYFITSTVIRYLVNYNFFWHPSCWILVESTWLLCYLNSLVFPFWDIDPKSSQKRTEK